MKLLLFILGLALCTALPAFRGLEENGLTDQSDFTLLQNGDELEETKPRWLFDDAIPSAEEGLGNGEESLPDEEETGEETLPKDLLTQIRENTLLNGIFNFGFDGVINAGIAKNKIPNTTFTVNNVSDFSQVNNGNQQKYTFSSEAVSKNGASVINMNFTVKHNSVSGNNTLGGYSYTIKTTSQTDDSYVELTPSQISTDSEVEAVLDYGVEQILQKGYANGKIPESDYDVSKVVSVFRMRQKTKNYYKFNVELEGLNDVLVKANFTASINPSTEEIFLSGYSYQASNIKFSINETAYTQVSEEEIDTNSVIQDCLEFAIEEVVKQPQDYDVQKINAVYTQTVKAIVYYKYDVELTNHKNKTIKLVATVAYKPETGAMDVKTYEAKTTTVSKK